MLDRIFGDLPECADLVIPPTVQPARVGETVVVDLDIPQSAIRFGRNGIGRKDADYIPAMVLNHIFGGGAFQSRLFKEVREKRGLAYSVWSTIAANDHATLLFGGTSTKNERAAEAISVIRQQVAALTTDGPTDLEIEKAKKYIIGSYPLRFDTSTKIAAQLVQIQLDELGIDWMQRRNALVAASRARMWRARRTASSATADCSSSLRARRRVSDMIGARRPVDRQCARQGDRLGGLSEAAIATAFADVASAVEKSAPSASRRIAGAADAPDETSDLATIRSLADIIVADAKDVVFLGTGGSALGAQTLAQLADHGVPGLAQRAGLRAHFMDNLSILDFRRGHRVAADEDDALRRHLQVRRHRRNADADQRARSQRWRRPGLKAHRKPCLRDHRA